MKAVVIRDEAAEDMDSAYRFYERIELGVGGHFIRCILADLEELERLHGFHRLHFGFHRVLSKRFPFGIYYRVKPERVEVFAVLDLRMEPTWIREELSNRKVE